MKHIVFEEADSYPVAVLIKPSYLRQYELERHYLDRLHPEIVAHQVIAFDLDYGGKKKVTNKVAKAYLEDELLPVLTDLKSEVLYVCDAEYFKVLTKVGKTEPHYGYALPCKIKGYEHLHVVLGVNYGQLIYNPELASRLDLTLDALVGVVKGTYKALGEGVIHYAHYPQTVSEISAALEQLHQYPTLAADIETFSLKVDKAGVATIGFAWDQHEGIAFCCDYKPLPGPQDGLHGENVPNNQVRYLLRRFFQQYRGRLRWHNASFDLRSLIWALFMKDAKDYKGMLEGLDVMCRHFDDTKIIAYLATNSTAGNVLGLKALAHSHAGNYAEDEIKDVRRIPRPQLLEYNLVDVLCTNYVYDTHYPTMIRDHQEEIYTTLMLPSLKVLTQMELTGMPIDQDAVADARKRLEWEADSHMAVFKDNPIIERFEERMTQQAWERDYEERRAKAKNPDKILPKDRKGFPRATFNPNSGPQMQALLYEDMDLPVIDKTKTKLPATGGKTLKKLINHTNEPTYREVIEALIGWTKVDKILTAFIPNFEAAIDKGDGKTWLHGNFNLGGTVSGRLSSNNPNLQQIPSGSTYGKLIKQCFQAPSGWIFCGADFSSLEDRINALLTKDPNKLKVYTDGFDGHALRTYHYWPQEFPHLREIPEDINTIDEQDHPLRQESKGPTFALTFQGTWQTLVKNNGFSEAEAKRIEANYHKLYQVSTAWVKERIAEAARQGYAEVAFGLRIRAPLLKQTMLGHRTTPYEAEAEARTLGNALSGQSYGLLNNRAANAFMARVWASEFRYDVMPVALIHDAVYLLVRDRSDVVAWVNQALIEEMEWQELPEIQHDEVKLGAALDLYWPTWAHTLTLPNGAAQDEIEALCAEHIAKGQQEKEAA